MTTTPMTDEPRSLQFAGAVTDPTASPERELESTRLAAIVSSSDDAIISKTLDGKILSWNAGATNIFGYEATDMIGQSIFRINPPQLYEEEKQILNWLRQGERIHHYETARHCQTKFYTACLRTRTRSSFSVFAHEFGTALRAIRGRKWPILVCLDSAPLPHRHGGLRDGAPSGARTDGVGP